MNKIFSNVFLEPGDKILIANRRLFQEDRPRFFLGMVEAFNDQNGLLKVTGYTLAQCQFEGKMVRKEEPRTKILALTAGILIVYQLPVGTNLEKAKLRADENGILQLSDGGALSLDLTEFPLT